MPPESNRHCTDTKFETGVVSRNQPKFGQNPETAIVSGTVDLLLRYTEKAIWHHGNAKTNANSVVAFDETGAQIGVVFQTASPFDTPRLMTELVA